LIVNVFFFFFQAEDGIRDADVTGVQTCALPILMKAILTHSAFESGLYTGPDYKFGYGLVNALGAAEIIMNSNQNAITENRKLLDGSTHTVTVTAKGDEPIKVSIAWIDPAGVGVPQNAVPLNDRTPKLVNDLDLRVSDGTTTYFPWKLDPENPA